MDNNPLPADAKPIAEFQTLLDSLLEIFNVSKAKSGQRFPFVVRDKKMYFFLVQGHCHVKRERDSLILNTIDAPAILGSNDFVLEPPVFYIQAITPISYLHLPLDEVLQHAEKHSLWKPLAFSMMYMSAQLSSYANLNTAIDNYELIRNQLQALLNEDLETRMTIPAVKYIQDRTTLSRSGVMKTLSDLNKGGYIVITRGLLVKINSLPLKY